MFCGAKITAGNPARSLDGSASRGRHRGPSASPRSKPCSTPSSRASPSPVSTPPTAAVAAAAAAAAAAEFGRTIAAEFLLGGAGNLNARAYAAAKISTDGNNEDAGAFLGCTREDNRIRGRTPPSSRTAGQGPSGIGSGGIWGESEEIDVTGGHHAGGDNRTPVVFVPYGVAGVGDQTLAAKATTLGSAASVVQQQQQQQQPEGIFRRVKGMQDRAGQTQARNTKMISGLASSCENPRAVLGSSRHLSNYNPPPNNPCVVWESRGYNS